MFKMLLKGPGGRPQANSGRYCNTDGGAQVKTTTPTTTTSLTSVYDQAYYPATLSLLSTACSSFSPIIFVIRRKPVELECPIYLV